MKAHQRLVRERMANGGGDLFGRWWDDVDTDIGRAVVRPIERQQASAIIRDYEWLGCMPAVSWFYFGIYFGDALGGAVVYGPEYSENLGKQARESGRKCADWSKYGFEGKMILLSRGACVHWAHPHAGSKLIRRSMDMLPPRFEVVTATCDPAAGEIGTIYQACGFVYVGSMREANPNVRFKPRDRHAWKIGGKLVGTRAMRALVGSTKQADVLSRFPGAVVHMEYSKHRYFAFRGPGSRYHRRAISHLVKPYPKREEKPRQPEGPRAAVAEGGQR